MHDAQISLLQSYKTYAPIVGGIERTVGNLARGWAKRNLGSSEVLATGPSRTSELLTSGERLTRVRAPITVASLPLAPAYPFELLAQQADVLCLHEPSLLGSAACLLRPNKIRSHFGTIALWWHSEIVRQRAVRPIYQPILRAALRSADYVVVATPRHLECSPALADFAGKVVVIPHGVEPAHPTEGTPAKFSLLQPGYVLFVGRLVYYKGIDVFMKAVEKSSTRAVVVGTGPLEPVVRGSAAMKRGLVDLYSGLSDDELNWLYWNCSTLVLPSVENAETYGLVQIEAMMREKPVITSDLPTGVTWVNQDGKTGLVVERGSADALAAAITELVRDTDLARSMGRYARARAEAQFSVDAMVNEFVDLVTSRE